MEIGLNSRILYQNSELNHELAFYNAHFTVIPPSTSLRLTNTKTNRTHDFRRRRKKKRHQHTHTRPAAFFISLLILNTFVFHEISNETQALMSAEHKFIVHWCPQSISRHQRNGGRAKSTCFFLLSKFNELN